MIRRISVRGIVLHEGKLLCVRLKPYKEHLRRDNSYWCLPGGGLDEIEEIDFVEPASTHILPEFLKTEPLAAHAARNFATKVITRL